MRRRQQRLHVNTFPFLAVLLCTMGSLILVLLVMDRRAKRAALLKAQREAAQVAQRQAEEAAERRTAWEREQQTRQAEQERRRQELHTRLVREESELEKQQRRILQELAAAAVRLRGESQSGANLRQQEQQLRTQVVAARKALADRQAALTQVEGASEAAREELRRMTSDLSLLEQTLKALQAARERERQTYSVVPYHGKQGDARRPLYVECTAAGLLFPPEKISVPLLSASGVQAEVRRRLDQQREQARAAGDKADPKPYMLLLVRPDGVLSGNALQGVLREMGVDYGYELIDADWVLAFPTDDQPLPRPWATAQGTPVAPAGPDSRPLPGKPMTHGPHEGQGLGTGTAGRGFPGGPGGGGPVVAHGTGGRGVGLGGDGAAGGSDVPPGGVGCPLASSGSNAGMSGPRGRKGYGGGFPLGGGDAPPDFANPPPPATMAMVGASGAGRGGPLEPPRLGAGGPGLSDGSPGSGSPGGGDPSAPAGVALGPPAGDGAPGIPGSPSVPGRPAGIGNRSSLSPSPGGGAGSSQGADGPQGGGQSGAPADPMNPLSPMPGGGGSSGSAPAAVGAAGTTPPSPDGRSDAPHLPYPDVPMNRGGGARLPTGSTDAPPESPDGSQQPQRGQRSSAGSAGDASARGGVDDGLGRFAPPSAPGGAAKKPRTVTLRPARLHGDRDWVLFLECRPDCVVLYPPGRTYYVQTLVGDNQLLATLQDMIARRQALVRPGDLPYRPHLRFMVRPESLRTYYQVFPMLEALPIPKSRQNLQPEDDVEAILAGS
jgi:hypothetical protein